MKKDFENNPVARIVII